MIDGGLSGSGVLDIARQTKMRIKSLAYAYRMSNQTTYADRAYRELKVRQVKPLALYLHPHMLVFRTRQEIRPILSEMLVIIGIQRIFSM